MGGVQRMCDGFGGAFKFRPLDKDDAVPRVRKAEEWELRRPWPSVHVQRRCAPTRTECEERAQFSSTAPCRNPRPSPHSFSSVGPAIVWNRVQSRVRWLGGHFKFRPLDKDDAVPTLRKAVRGRCDGGPASGAGGNRYTVQRSLRWLSRAAVRWGPRFTSTDPCRNPRPGTCQESCV
jgi:hypothetical protein